MRALVVYYSVTGTTRSIAERIAAGLESAGAHVALHNLRNGQPDAGPFDIVGIGFPVHYFRAAAPVTRAVRALGRLDGRSGFVFALHGTHRGRALNQVRGLLRRRGAAVTGALSFYGDDRFLGYTRLGYEFSPDHPTPDELASATEFGAGLVSAHVAALGGSRPPVRSDPATPVIYALERMSFSPWLVRSVYSRVFRADPDRCTRCGRCARVCPSNNIAWSTGAQPQWSRDCIGCFACAEACPNEAIHSALDWPVFRPFLAYNVRRARRDPTLEHARVELHRGKIVRR